MLLINLNCENKTLAYLFCAVLGVGCDAKVAWDIHLLREESPEKFYNQVEKINLILLMSLFLIFYLHYLISSL